jgi:cell wall-associated NlpC family hydrolase
LSRGKTLLTSSALDPRRHPYRGDLAAEALRGLVAAPRYVTGELRQVVSGVAPLWSRPDASAGWASQALYGELVTVYDERDGLAWVQLARDGYVGYVPAAALSLPAAAPTHTVAVPATCVYAAPNAKALTRLQLSLNAVVSVAEMGPGFAGLVGGGFVPAVHLAEIGASATDFVAVAERLIGTPYVWGGKTRQGLDCSGLVQTALHAAGREAPRDSDMQMAELGTPIEVPSDPGAPAPSSALERGDLVFWAGHVGILTDGVTLLHANAHHMAVTVEPLARAAGRIARSGSPIAAIKRIAPRVV